MQRHGHVSSIWVCIGEQDGGDVAEVLLANLFTPLDRPLCHCTNDSLHLLVQPYCRRLVDLEEDLYLAKLKVLS
jgi:hypothetical protein